MFGFMIHISHHGAWGCVLIVSSVTTKFSCVNIRFPFPGIPQSAFCSLLTWEGGVGEVFSEQ